MKVTRRLKDCWWVVISVAIRSNKGGTVECTACLHSKDVSKRFDVGLIFYKEFNVELNSIDLRHLSYCKLAAYVLSMFLVYNLHQKRFPFTVT